KTKLLYGVEVPFDYPEHNQETFESYTEDYFERHIKRLEDNMYYDKYEDSFKLEASQYEPINISELAKAYNIPLDEIYISIDGYNEYDSEFHFSFKYKETVLNTANKTSLENYEKQRDLWRLCKDYFPLVVKAREEYE